ncbi:transglutaminaseTgpA domain-containing protein [Agromyces salentinus]|uniref:Transglutaminase-like domain-containing protein n=1 Tax=Agromyces salentinus TaxID=269421 RepID=A0ABN2MY61_9MICO|nr:transglutaminaseTgpA domain-containing protein [Agromyces salentinus]
MSSPAPSAGRSRIRDTLTALVLALVVGTAMISWWPVYESGDFIIAAAVAIVAGSVIALVGAWRAWPTWRVIVAVVVAFLVLGVPAAVPSRSIGGVLPTVQGLLDLVAATALSWKQLVTIAVPVGSYQALLVPPFLLGMVTATVSVTIALRTRHPVAAILPPAFLMVAGILLGVVHGGYALPAGLAFLVAVVAWLVLVAIDDRRAIGGRRTVENALADARRVLGASTILALALVGATAVVLLTPVQARTVVRSEVQPPFEPREHESPLAGYRAAFAPDDADDVMLEVTGLAPGAGLRVATMDTYDGVVYTVGGSDGTSSSGSFTRVPYRLDQEAGRDGTQVRLDVRILAYDDVWVPGIGKLERIEFGGPRAETLADAFFYNDATGTAAVVTGLGGGDRYAAWSMAVGDATTARTLTPGTSVVPAAPELPIELEGLLDDWAPASLPEGERLAAVVDGFRSNGYVSHGTDGEAPSRSGHALDRLSQLATDQPMLGDAEQYAVAAAMMARRIGFPARVVVGYRASDATAATPAGGMSLLRSDLQAWIEVERADGTWVALDPNPVPRPVPEREPDQPLVVSRPQAALPPPPERTQVDVGEDADDRAEEQPREESDQWIAILRDVLTIAGLVVLAAALVASPFLAVIVAKLRRRRLRRRADSEVERIEGGWQEFADTAADYGYPIRAGSTRAEQAATVGGLAPLVLASIVDRAVFAPGGPAPGDDERVWRSVDELQQRLAAPRTRREQLRAAVSLTSLGGYAVSRRGGRA